MYLKCTLLFKSHIAIKNIVGLFSIFDIDIVYFFEDIKKKILIFIQVCYRKHKILDIQLPMVLSLILMEFSHWTLSMYTFNSAMGASNTSTMILKLLTVSLMYMVIPPFRG